MGVGVSATSAGRSAQQYLCVAIVIGYSRSDPAIDIGEFGSYSQGIRRLRMGPPRLIFADEVHLAQPPRIEGQGICHISRLIQLLCSFDAINIGYFIHVDKAFEELSTTTDVLTGL